MSWYSNGKILNVTIRAKPPDKRKPFSKFSEIRTISFFGFGLHPSSDRDENVNEKDHKRQRKRHTHREIERKKK